MDRVQLLESTQIQDIKVDAAEQLVGVNELFISNQETINKFVSNGINRLQTELEQVKQPVNTNEDELDNQDDEQLLETAYAYSDMPTASDSVVTTSDYRDESVHTLIHIPVQRDEDDLLTSKGGKPAALKSKKLVR